MAGRRMAGALVALTLLMGCSEPDEDIRSLENDVIVQHPDARGVVQGAIAGGVHWGRYTVNGRPQADIRFVIIADRQSDPQGTTGLQIFINAWNNVWRFYPALPYLLYADQRSIGVCTGQFGSSVIQICTGNPGAGVAGATTYSYDSALHFLGPYIVNRDQSTVGWAYTLVCHEVGHALGLAHSPETSSCMNSRLQGESRGYTPTDLGGLLGVYYSHFPG